MKGKKVAVGMSGGVDSSVTAAILKARGYDVTGVFIEAYNEPGCRTDQDKKDALQVALQLGIRFEILDVRREYKKKVVDYFFETYKRGATPNPDVVCNREVKFGLFYDWAMKNGFEMIATGHYARIAKSQYLQRAVDRTKDQSYFLWQVPADHLARVIFPLGEMTKAGVRAKAKKLRLPNAEKPDSMGVCMMGELNVYDFLEEHLGEQPGEVVMEGWVVGRHRGLWFHTVGQRGGFEVDKKALKKLGYQPEEMVPLYVIGKEKEKNWLIVGRKEQAYTSKFSITNFQLSINDQMINFQGLISKNCLFVRIRNLGELNEVRSLKIEKRKLKIQTKLALFGVAEGQAAVLYARLGEVGNEVVVAGGEIGV